MKYILLFLGVIFSVSVYSQSNRTITIGDATNDYNNTNENMGTESSRTGYLTWDANNLYISVTGNPLVSTSSNFYVVIDLDPVTSADSRSGTGRSDQPTTESGGATYPFNADVVYLFYGTGSNDGSIVNPASGLKYTISAGSWTNTAISSGVRTRRHNTDITDFEIPFSDIGISASSNFNIIFYVANNTGGGSNFAQWPTTNTNGNNPTLKDFYSFNRTTGVTPNASSNFSFRETIAGYTAAGTTFGRIYFVPSTSQTYDFGTTTSFRSVYVNSNATVQFNASGTVNFSEDLYVDGATTPRQSTLNFNGTTQNIGGSGTLNVYGLTIANGSTTTLAGNITLVDFSNSYGTVTVTGTLHCGTRQFLSPGGSGSGTNVNVNGILSTTNSNGLSGSSSTTFQTTRINLSLGSSSTIQYSATGAQTVSARSDYNNLTISGSGTKTLGGSASITGLLNVSAGTFDMNALSFTLKSGSSTTARVGNTAGTISNATNVTVERYIPAKRAWRFLTAPLTGSSNNSIFYNWQNNGSIGTGVELWTSPGNGGSANPSGAASGLAIGTSTNILSYNGGWASVNNSKTTNLFTSGDNNSYCIFVTGPFQNGSGNISSGATATTLSATGTLRTGNTTVSLGSLAADQYALVGNPFASPVDPSLLTGTNLKSSFWMWDPNLAGSYGFGGYVTFNRTLNQYNITSASYSNSPLSQIQSGQAFFVQATAAASTDITFDEADKSTTVNNAQFRNTANGFELLRFTLQKDFAANNTFTSTDAAVAVFHASIGQKGIDSYDISKLNNSGENIALIRSTSSLVFEHRPMVSDKDTLYLRIWNTTAANYRLFIQPEDISAMAGLTAILKDNYLNTESPISLSATTTINFSVDANAGSSGDRFVIYFRPSTPLPVDYTAIKASPLENKIKVEWSVANEKNITTYIVEKSKDGKSFDKAASATATGAAYYSWIDNTPYPEVNYYRVKSIGLNGESQYSNIVKVSNRTLQPLFSVYPNPVKGNSFEVNIASAEKGVFTMRMFNAAGGLQLQQVLPHNGGTSIQRIMLPNVLPSGLYVLELKAGTETFTKTIMIR